MPDDSVDMAPNNRVGTKRYMAPEVRAGCSAYLSSDMVQSGMTQIAVEESVSQVSFMTPIGNVYHIKTMKRRNKGPDTCLKGLTQLSIRFELR